jgi:hypothetical protein
MTFVVLARTVILVSQYRLGVQEDVDRSAADDPALVYDIVPTDTKVMSVDPGLGDEPGPQPRTLVYPFPIFFFPPRSSPLAEVVDRKLHLARHSTNRERACQDVVARAGDFHLIAYEYDPRMMLDIKKISAAEMRVALRLPRPDFSGIDGHVNGRMDWILRIEH